MKYLLILLFAVPTSAQSLDETLEYLRDTVPVAGTIRTKDDVLSFIIEAEKFETCNVSWVETIAGVRQKIAIPLGSTEFGLSENTKLGLWQVHLTGDIKVVSIRYKDVTTMKAYQIHVKDKTTAEKLVKAFTHAAKLCLAQKELF